MDACISRAATFEAHGDKLLFSLDPSQEFAAFRSYFDGEFYLSTLTMSRQYLRGITTEKLTRLDIILNWMRLACAIHCMNNGPLIVGIMIFERLFKRTIPMPREVFMKASLYMGIVLMQHSKELQAMYYFRVALQGKPGWVAANRKVDELYQRIQHDARLKARLAVTFELILAPVRIRHQMHEIHASCESHRRVYFDPVDIHLIEAITRMNDVRLTQLWLHEQSPGGPILLTNFPHLPSVVALAKRRRNR
ncbi:MAG: hypothetical protein Q9185_002781 [Variospora sp. 1 TL-2023]